ncbi:nucleotidyltransferase domain-containing protein [candidate division KSB1 bacterium]|nr:nucleotidyltransferase domain-containing protein [candidate division KSB1 bacterium]
MNGLKNMEIQNQLTDSDRSEVQDAVNVLKEYGVKRVFLFGSLVAGRHHRLSDIDLACEGISPDRFFKVLGRLLSTMGKRVDLVDLKEVKKTLRKRIVKEGMLLYEAK